MTNPITPVRLPLITTEQAGRDEYEPRADKVEAVARALAELCWNGCESADHMVACIDPPCECRQAARVAIRALDEYRANKNARTGGAIRAGVP